MYKIFLFIPVILFLPGQLFSAGTGLYKDIDPKLKVLKQQVLKDILASPANEKEVMQLLTKMKKDGS